LATLGKVCLSVAHELRNPLSGIKMHARLLKDRLGPSSGDSAIEVMLREIDRMELYLDELMSLSVGSDPAHRSLCLAPTRLSDLSESVLTILSGRCRHAKIAVKKDYPAAEPQLSADASQLRQVMMNLMVNAIEAMPSGGTMSVSVYTGQSSVVFRVADAGKGIGPRERDIFEAFVTGKPNGVGLGLYLCKQIVARHGGSIGYDDSAAGATFWFELPLAAAK
jgi:signal transduction histidine kinase